MSQVYNPELRKMIRQPDPKIPSPTDVYSNNNYYMRNKAINYAYSIDVNRRDRLKNFPSRSKYLFHAANDKKTNADFQKMFDSTENKFNFRMHKYVSEMSLLEQNKNKMAHPKYAFDNDYQMNNEAVFNRAKDNLAYK